MPGQSIEKIWGSDPTIHAPAKYKRACRYSAFVPDELSSLDLHLAVETAGLVAEAEEAVRALNNVAHPGLASFARLLLRTESIASSKVEGMQMGLRDLARAEARMQAGGRRSETAVEILANIAAMEIAVTDAAAASPFTEQQILDIHARLLPGDRHRKIAGRFRTGQNWIGGNDYNPCGAVFVPPPVDEVPRLLRDLCAAVNSELAPPLVQAALVHAQFETIHPFDDGNGRTGRALIHVVLRRRGLTPNYVPPISVVLAAARDQYINGLSHFRADSVAEWVEQFAVAAARSAAIAVRYLEAVRALMASWREKLARSGALRRDAAAWAIIEILPAYPIITALVAASASGRSKGPVYDAIDQLERAGVLIPLSQSTRNQAWEAEGLLSLLESLEQGDEPVGNLGGPAGDGLSP